MKRIKSRKSQPTDSFEQIAKLGDELRRQHSDVRYVEVIFHTGTQWSVRATWERLEDCVWIPFDLPISNY